MLAKTNFLIEEWCLFYKFVLSKSEKRGRSSLFFRISFLSDYSFISDTIYLGHTVPLYSRRSFTSFAYTCINAIISLFTNFLRSWGWSASVVSPRALPYLSYHEREYPGTIGVGRMSEGCFRWTRGIQWGLS